MRRVSDGFGVTLTPGWAACGAGYARGLALPVGTLAVSLALAVAVTALVPCWPGLAAAVLTALLWAGPEPALAADGPALDRLLTGSAVDGDLAPPTGSGCRTAGRRATATRPDARRPDAIRAGCDPGANPVTLITTRQVMAANAKAARARGRRRRRRDGAAARAGGSKLSATVGGGPGRAGA